MKFALQLTEYVVLRLVRRFLFPYSLLLRIGHLVPYFRVNTNQDSAAALVDTYERLVRENCPEVLQRGNLRILEIGAGVTNTVGLLLAERLNCEVDVCDPYVRFDAPGTAEGVKRFAISQGAQQRTKRVSSPDTNAYDLILSNSVLEHVENPTQFFGQMKTALREGGRMIHRVDYRDHFFKYPFFFLMFSDVVWNTFLNPGDLYRWRLDDHLATAEQHWFAVHVTERQLLPDAYHAVMGRIQKRFTTMANNDVATATIVTRFMACD